MTGLKEIVQQFVDVETAKTAGRKQSGEMLRFIENNCNCRTIVAEKTDRLYRYIVLSRSRGSLQVKHLLCSGRAELPTVLNTAEGTTQVQQLRAIGQSVGRKSHFYT